MTPARPAERWLPFVPSLLFGLAGGIWMVVDPPRFQQQSGPATVLLAAAAVAAALLAGAWLLERTVPSFRHASRQLERALGRLRLSPGSALLLAAATAAGEELFFRGGLMQVVGVWGQALVFGALHPVSWRGWAYTLFTMLAGALFGYAVLLTGNLWTPLLAHFAVNLHGLLSARRGH